MRKNGNYSNHKKASTWLQLALLIALAFASALFYFRFSASNAPNQINSVPIYSIWTSGAPRFHQLEKNCLRGITYYIGWSKIEPAKGEYNFSELLKVLKEAKKHNKKVNIAFLTGRWSPEWIYDIGVAATQWDHTDVYTASDLNTPSKAPIPWDEVYKSNFYRMLDQASMEISPYKKTINSISITGGSNTNGIEMNFIGPTREMNRIGFTYERYINNWESITNKFSTTFTDYQLSLALHTHFGPDRTAKVSDQITKNARTILGDRLIISALAFTEDDWFNPGNLYADLFFNQPAESLKSLQTMKTYAKPNEKEGFHSMLNKASLINPTWLEVWGADADKYLDCEPGNNNL